MGISTKYVKLIFRNAALAKKGQKIVLYWRISTIEYNFKSYYTGDCTKLNRTKGGPPVFLLHFPCFFYNFSHSILDLYGVACLLA